jgi:hypothetical protein
MKIRGKLIEDVIEFDPVDHDGLVDKRIFHRLSVMAHMGVMGIFISMFCAISHWFAPILERTIEWGDNIMERK